MGTQYAFGQIVTDGLVLCLNASDRNSYVSGSTTWNDVSGRGNNGTLTNGPTFNSANGGSIVFDFSNDYVKINSFADILSKTTYTKTAWFYMNSYKYNIVSGGDTAQHAFWMAGTNKLSAGHNSAWQTVTSATSLLLNTWYFGVVTFNTTTGWSLYVNGNLESTSSSTTTFSGTGGILIGAFNDAQNLWDGRIAMASVYNRVLSPQEVQQNYNSQKSRFGII
jgi:hypothetical protein